MYLEDKFKSGQFVMTAEIAPPVSFDAADLMAMAGGLKGVADAVNVTDGASAKSHMSALAAAAILNQNGIEPILQFTCRDRNRLAIQSDLMGAAALGIRNMLLLFGDKPEAGDQPDTKAVHDVTTDQIAETARRMREQHQLPTGKEIKGSAHFLIGMADAPQDPKPDWQPDRLKGKIAAGAQFCQTQFCMDGQVLRRYMARLVDAGIVPGVSYLVGIAPLRSAKSARWMKDKLFGTIIPDEIVARMEGASDAVAEGIKIAGELIEDYATIPGVSGVHIMAPLNEHAVPDVIKAARKTVSKAAKV